MYYEDNDQEAYLEYVKMRNEQLKEQSRIETERDEKEKLAINEQMAIYNETYGDYDARDKYSELCNDMITSVVETALNVLFEKWVGSINMSIISDDTKNFNRSLVAGYIKENGATNLIESFKGKTALLSELAYIIENSYKSILEEVDQNEESTYIVSKDEEDFFENIKSDDTVEDLCDIIRTRFANDTTAFMDSNSYQKDEITNSLLDIEERINAVKVGSEELDEQARYDLALESEIIKERILSRPISVMEAIFHNITQSIISNDVLKEQYCNESGQIDNDNIFEKTSMRYTFLQMLEGFRIQHIDEEFLMTELGYN